MTIDDHLAKKHITYIGLHNPPEGEHGDLTRVTLSSYGAIEMQSILLCDRLPSVSSSFHIIIPMSTHIFM